MLSFMKILPIVFMAFAVVCNAATDVIPIAPVGDVAGVQSILGNEDSRLFYQDGRGYLVQVGVSGPFTRAGSTTTIPPGEFATPAEVLWGTPIAACTYDNGTVGIGFYEIHIFFFSPQYVLSEYYYYAPTETAYGGANCSTCITQEGFVASNGSEVLYAMEDPTDNTIRVGFISAGSPNTLSEAVRSAAGAWSVATLPNA